MEKSGRFAQKRLDLSVKSGTIELNFMSVPRYSGRGRMITQDVAVTSREGRVSRKELMETVGQGNNRHVPRGTCE